jgi:hypothetical protein
MSQATTAQMTNLVAERSCDGCTMCCKLYEIPSLAKPENTWCTHCDTGKGCTVYETRPRECRDFFCHYRIDANVPEHWKPSRCHMALRSDASGTHIIVTVDPKRAAAWREAPYYRDLKAWAANRMPSGRQVHVRIGGRVIVVLPDRDVDLGVVGDRAILATRTTGPDGRVTRMDFEVVARDDPRVTPSPAPAPAPGILRRKGS